MGRWPPAWANGHVDFRGERQRRARLPDRDRRSVDLAPASRKATRSESGRSAARSLALSGSATRLTIGGVDVRPPSGEASGVAGGALVNAILASRLPRKRALFSIHTRGSRREESCSTRAATRIQLLVPANARLDLRLDRGSLGFRARRRPIPP